MGKDQDPGDYIPASHLRIAIEDVRRSINSAALAYGRRKPAPGQFPPEVAAYITLLREPLINWQNDGEQPTEADKRYRRRLYGNVTTEDLAAAKPYRKNFSYIKPSSRFAIMHAVNVGQVTFGELAWLLAGRQSAGPAQPKEFRHDPMPARLAGQKGGLKHRRPSPPEQQSA
jgi:hypothetical protein